MQRKGPYPMNNHLKAANPLTIPQTKRTNDRQVENNTGGYVYKITDEARLKRFLILGTAGTMYQPAGKMTNNNLTAIETMWRNSPAVVSAIIEDISHNGKAHNNDYALVALAVGVAVGGEARKLALAALPKVARIGTHILHFANFLKNRSGWGRSVRTAISKWYTGRSADKMAYQVMKYQSRDGWSHKDLLKMCHALNNQTPAKHKSILEYVMHDKITPELLEAAKIIDGFEKVKKAETVKEVVNLMKEYDLPRELIPTQWLNEKAVWKELLNGMLANNLLEALVRNLNKMTAIGMFEKAELADKVAAAIESHDNLKAARLHPLKLLVAYTTYNRGCGLKGSLSWTVNRKISKALENAFYAAFDFVEPTNKNVLLGIDASASMTWNDIDNTNINPRVAATCMAMVTARTEKNRHIMTFSSIFEPFPVDPHAKLEDITNMMSRLPATSTDCALPMKYAIENDLDIDTFIIYTDNETNSGIGSPDTWLKKYRKTMNKPNAQLIVVAFTATEFSIADPQDPNMFDVAGFSTDLPTIMSSFMRGEF